MTTNPVSNANSPVTAGTKGTAPANPSDASGVDNLASEETFLKLFVAQLKNQDPTAPQDPTQFVSQLAQMSGLEQSLQMRQDLDAILKTLETNSATSNSSTPTT